MNLIVQGEEVETPDLKALAKIAEGETIERVSENAFRITKANAASREAVAAHCARAKLDFGFVADGRTLPDFALLAMDMDSTLIGIECIDEIADFAGRKREVAEVTAAAMRGEIDFRASLTRRVALLEGLPIEALARVYDERLQLSPGAARLFETLHAIGAKTLLVSGGFTFFTERLKTRLGIDFTRSNVLDVENGRLTGRIQGDIVDADAKASCFSALAQRFAGGDGLAVAIGDGANDLPMLAAANVSVAYHAKPRVREQAMHAIDHCGLDAVLNLFS